MPGCEFPKFCHEWLLQPIYLGTVRQCTCYGPVCVWIFYCSFEFILIVKPKTVGVHGDVNMTSKLFIASFSWNSGSPVLRWSNAGLRFCKILQSPFNKILVLFLQSSQKILSALLSPQQQTTRNSLWFLRYDPALENLFRGTELTHLLFSGTEIRQGSAHLRARKARLAERGLGRVFVGCARRTLVMELVLHTSSWSLLLSQHGFRGGFKGVGNSALATTDLGCCLFRV